MTEPTTEAVEPAVQDAIAVNALSEDGRQYGSVIFGRSGGVPTLYLMHIDGINIREMRIEFDDKETGARELADALAADLTPEKVAAELDRIYADLAAQEKPKEVSKIVLPPSKRLRRVR